MRTTAWLLPVGLVLAVIGGCSSSRFGLAKSDRPASKPKDADEVVYGNPWKKPKKADPKAAEEMSAELAQLRKDMDAAKTASNDLTPWLKNAAEAEGKGDLAAAKGLYQKILDKEPNHAEAHHRLAVIADQQQDARTADEHYLKALTMNRRDADLLSDMGYSLYLRGKYDQSESRLKEALEANPYHRGAQSNLGLVYGRQGKYDQALAAFRQAGTESEAQKNIAQIFPNGRPGSAPDQSGTAVADTERRAAPPLPTDVDQRLDGQFADVMKQMHQQREAAERVRSQQPVGPAANQGMPTGGQPIVHALPPTNNATGTNNAPVNWPPVATTAPPTFNQFGGNGAGNNPPGMAPGANWGTPAAPTMASAGPTNVAKPQDPSPFWTGHSGNTLPEQPAPSNFSGTPTNNGFPANPNAQPNSGIAMNPPAGNVWGNPVAPPTMGNNFPPQSFAAPTNDIRQAGFADSANPRMNDAQRIAAQMAMGTGPGGLLPLVNPGPTAAPLPGTNATNGVNWAYGEMSGNSNRNVENAVWTNPEGINQGAPVNNAAPPTATPGQPWGDWASPAPAAINWGQPPSGNAAPASAAPWDGQPAASAPAPWNGGVNSSSNSGLNPNSSANANVDTYRWDGTPVTAPAGNAAPNDGRNSNNGNATTIPNWPHAPNRL